MADMALGIKFDEFGSDIRLEVLSHRQVTAFFLLF